MQKGFLTPIIGVVVLILVVVIGAYYLDTKNSSITPTNPSPNPTQVTIPEAKSLALGKLSFNTSANWWSEYHKDDKTDKEWFLLNSQALSRPSDAQAAFELHFYPKANYSKIEELISAYSLDVQSKEQTKVDSKAAEKITGKVALGPLAGKEVTLVGFSNNDGYYVFINHGLDKENMTVFNQILSSFKINN